MKNLLLSTALLLAASFTFGQTLGKGNELGVHVLTVELKPNVTMEQVIDFYKTKYFPAAEKSFGWKGFIGQGIRGVDKGDLILIWYFKSEKDRDKYFKMEEGEGTSLNELGKKAWAQFAPTNDELDKLATIQDDWTNWVIK